MKICLYIITFLYSISVVSQEDRKSAYNGFISFPTTRGFLYSLGMEREQKMNENTSCSIAIGASLLPQAAGQSNGFYNFSLFLQPFHIITGRKKLKFETGISVSYLDYNLSDNPNSIPYPPDKMFCGNLFAGIRYLFTERLSAHGGYMPRYVLGGNKNFNQKFFHGLELSFFYKIT